MNFKRMTSLFLSVVMAASAAETAATPIAAFAADSNNSISTQAASSWDYPNAVSAEIHLQKPVVFNRQADSYYDEYDGKTHYNIGLMNKYVQTGDYITVLRSDADGNEMSFDYYYDGEEYFVNSDSEKLAYAIDYSETDDCFDGTDDYIVLSAQRGEALVYMPVTLEDDADGWNGRSYIRDGQKVTGWQTIDGKTYYFNKDGLYLCDTRETIDGEIYYFDENGQYVTGNYDLGEYTLDFSNGPVTVSAEVYKAIMMTAGDVNDSNALYGDCLFLDNDTYRDVDIEHSEDWSSYVFSRTQWNTMNNICVIAHPESAHSGENYYSTIRFIFTDYTSDTTVYTLYTQNTVKMQHVMNGPVARPFGPYNDYEEEVHLSGDLADYLTVGDKIGENVRTNGVWAKEVFYVFDGEKFVNADTGNTLNYTLQYDSVWYGNNIMLEDAATMLTLEIPVEWIDPENGWYTKAGYSSNSDYRYYIRDGKYCSGLTEIDGKYYFFDTDQGSQGDYGSYPHYGCILTNQRKYIYNYDEETDTDHSAFYYFGKDGSAIKGNYDKGSYTLDFSKGSIKVSADVFKTLTTTIKDSSRTNPNVVGFGTSVGNNAIYLSSDNGPSIEYEYVDNNKNVLLSAHPMNAYEGKYVFTQPDSPYSGSNYYSTLTIKLVKGSGWVKLSDATYYYKDAHPVVGWQTIDGKRYYFNKQGKMQKYRQTINGKIYYFNGAGVLQTGWIKGNNWFYADKNGVLATGWKTIANKKYYFKSDGSMVKGWQKISGKWYYMNGSGVMQTGWVKLSGKWYYLNNAGIMQTGWQKISGTWYYFNASGAMQTGWQKISGKWYYFNSSGSMRTANLTYKGKTYCFNNSGVCLNP